MKVHRYTKEHKEIWDEFVKSAKNGHFFFQRDYMEYHRERFDDFSLLIYDDKERVISLLPSNVRENVLYSHQGLTFGGFIMDEHMKTETMLDIFDAVNRFCLNQHISTILYKCIPYIYHKQPSDEDRYALFRNNAKLIRRDVSSTICLQDKIEYQEQRKRSIKKAHKHGLVFEQSGDFPGFWAILEERLRDHHKVKPVHTLAEIETLASLFPEHIKLFIARKDGEVLGGTLIYENEQIVHTQYLANSAQGRSLGALDFVIDRLINEVYIKKKYFDFGISNEDNGKYLNANLITYKEGFGARAVVHEFYEIGIA